MLVGPCPPPYGGISVHVSTLERALQRAGALCRVLDVGGHRPTAKGALVKLLAELKRSCEQGFSLHLHTNGHNPKSWLLILACGLAGRPAPSRLLTLHSGMVPDYLAATDATTRALARLALNPFDRILCASARIRDAVAGLGVEPSRLEVMPAYLATPTTPVELPPALARWLAGHAPVLATALFFRPEYGFDLLLDAVERLRARHPKLGCLVLGGGDGVDAARREVAARGLGEAVELAGDVAHALCLALVARADLFVRPTRTDGDASSVREALDLGTPVVASDAAWRPNGTVLFPSGDATALAEKIDAVLCMAERPITAGTGAGDEGVARLLHIYRELCTREERRCEPDSWAS
jgi:glycosyltransferase involved in cell wall biosynthesis